MYFNHKYSNHNCDNMLYFMLGVTTTAMSCMGYCLCKHPKGESCKSKSQENHHNNDVSNLVRNMHKKMCRNNHKSRCHVKHHPHNHALHNHDIVEDNISTEDLNNTFE